MFALQVIYMKLNCVSKQYGTKLRCYWDRLGEFGEHIGTKACGKT
jgi:hypothetical protein